MKIIIAGAGKIGATMAEQLCREGHEITVIDPRENVVNALGEQFDIMPVAGNGSTYEVQMEAGVNNADLFIAATSTDETNLLCCLIAKKLGAKNTIARVRNPEYAREIRLIQDDLGLSTTFNPDMSTAQEISRILRIPSAIKVDTFAKGRVEMLKIRISKESILNGMTLIELGKLRANVLVCAVERGDHDVFIPSGSFKLEAGDRISIISKPKDALNFFKKIGIQTAPVREVILIGGSRIAIYLARIMLDYGADVRIIENNLSVCERLAEQLPKATVLHGDGMDHNLLMEQGIETADAVATLTGLDEENIIMSLYASRITKGKVITKIKHRTFDDITSSLDLNSVFNPAMIAAEGICTYVRALQNSEGSNVETLYQIVDGKAEALEFRVTADSKVCHKPLQELNLKKDLLIGSINRAGAIITPRGSDTIEPGDTVIVVTTNTGLNDLDDILDRRRG